jgi:hypothetical protein
MKYNQRRRRRRRKKIYIYLHRNEVLFVDGLRVSTKKNQPRSDLNGTHTFKCDFIV